MNDSAAAVDYVFKVMGATYGERWERSLGGSPIADIKTIWGDSLSDFMHSDDAKRAIIWGLKNLPDKVPNPREFRTLCKTAPSKPVEMLPAPKADPERLKIELSKLDVVKADSIRAIKVDHKAWAKKIVREYDEGIKRNPTIIKMAKDALKGGL